MTGLKAVLEQVHDLIGQDYEGRGNMHEIEENVLYDFALRHEGASASTRISCGNI